MAGLDTSATVKITTSRGAVRGSSGPSCRTFLDIPYATAPVGRRRFTPPEPHEPWTGVRDATRPGPTAPQPPRGRFGPLDLSPFFAPGWVPGDDHLTVNVWTPARFDRPAPVVVFVHGGAFLAGSNRAPVYDGGTFARDGVVLVGVNYRLGAAGFLHLPDAPDNRGVLDVVAALRWVQEEIAVFGGDPARVTLAGQSAGAIIVADVVTRSSAVGLVGQAIVQSGSAVAAFSPAQARLVTAALASQLGVDTTVGGFGRIDDQALVDGVSALQDVRLDATGEPDPLGGITPFSLVLDEQPADALARGAGGGVPMLIGSNSQESSLYVVTREVRTPPSARDVFDTAARFHPAPDRLLAAYRTALPGATPDELLIAVLSDGMFGAGTDAIARARSTAPAATWVYRFGWKSDALAGELGASHLMELPFVFDHTTLPDLRGEHALLGTTAPPADLATRVHRTWVDFATSGDPGWPASRPDTPALRQLATSSTRIDDPRRAVYDVWAEVRPPRALTQ